MIINKTKKTIISKNFQYKNGFEKTKGLLLNKRPECIVFKTRFGVHTFFMRFPIDVLILNKNNKVVCLKSNLLPNRIFIWNPIYDTVVELPKNSISNSKTKIGDLIDIKL